jgi:hypothetical protein
MDAITALNYGDKTSMDVAVTGGRAGRGGAGMSPACS